MSAAQVAVLPPIDGRERELMVMDIGQNVLMAPGRKRAKPGYALSVRVDVAAPADEIPVRPAAAQDDDVQLMGFEVFALGPVLDDGEPLRAAAFCW